MADDLFVREDWLDTMYHVMAKSPIGQPGRYLYSDNDFIFLGKVVEQVTGKPLNDYVHDVFYTPMGLDNIHYLPLHDVPRDRIVPTEYEKHFAGNSCAAMYTIPERQCSVAWPGMPGCSVTRMTLPA